MTEFKRPDRRACDNVINLRLTADRAEFFTDFDEPPLTVEMQMWAANFVMTKTVNTGRDARPSRNPFAEPSVSKQRGKNDVLRKARRVR